MENSSGTMSSGGSETTEELILVPHFIKGKTVLGDDIRHRSRDLGADFATPALDLDGMVCQRTAPGPAFDLAYDGRGRSRPSGHALIFGRLVERRRRQRRIDPVPRPVLRQDRGVGRRERGAPCEELCGPRLRDDRLRSKGVDFDGGPAGLLLRRGAARGSGARRRRSLSFNQDACNASRFQFVEAGTEQCDRYSALLAEAMGVDVRYGNGQYQPPPANIRDEVEMLKMLEPVYGAFGDYEGRGLLVRSDEPVGFHPNVKTVNVVQVSSLADALRYVTVATQTVGVWPPLAQARTA